LDLTGYVPLTLPERSEPTGGMMLADAGTSLSPMTVSPESGSTRPPTSPAGRIARLPSISGRLPANRLEQGLPAAKLDLMAAAHDAVLARFAHRPQRPVVLPAEAWAWLADLDFTAPQHEKPKKDSARQAALTRVLLERLRSCAARLYQCAQLCYIAPRADTAIGVGAPISVFTNRAW